MKILVIQQKMIGDVLTSTIICEALKQKYPESKIDYVINSHAKAVVLNHPVIDSLIEFKPIYRKSKREFYHFLLNIRKNKYDLVIDAYGKLESNLITLLSGAPKKISFYKSYTHFLYNKTIKRKNKSLTNASTSIENRLRLIYSEKEIPSNLIQPKIFLTSSEKEQAKQFLTNHGLSDNKPIYMIGVLGSGITKTLPFLKMAKIIDAIAKYTDAQLLFNYIPNQKEDAEKIYELTAEHTKKRIHFNVFEKSLRGFIAILSQCDALIGNEGGAVNMAKALNKPTFTIFSPWIGKEHWNMFEDGIKHQSVHLKDFRPDLYENKSLKSIKKDAVKYYSDFSTASIIYKLRPYLKHLKVKKENTIH